MSVTLATIKPGQAFTYGGMPWVKLEDASGGTLALAAESVFDRVFCTDTDRAIEQYNNWEYSTLRRELNDDFYESLLENGADAGAFLDMTVDLTADDGLDDYGTTTDKIALISCEQHRKYRRLIPDLEYCGDAQHRFRAAKIQRGKERVREMKNAHRMAMGGNRNERNFSNH